MKGSHVVRLVFIAEGVSKDKIPELVVHYSLIGNDMVYIATSLSGNGGSIIRY
jgi:hypothetical protein